MEAVHRGSERSLRSLGEKFIRRRAFGAQVLGENGFGCRGWGRQFVGVQIQGCLEEEFGGGFEGLENKTVSPRLMFRVN